jgi:hypothetical protein
MKRLLFAASLLAPLASAQEPADTPTPSPSASALGHAAIQGAISGAAIGAAVGSTGVAAGALSGAVNAAVASAYGSLSPSQEICLKNLRVAARDICGRLEKIVPNDKMIEEKKAAVKDKGKDVQDFVTAFYDREKGPNSELRNTWCALANQNGAVFGGNDPLVLKLCPAPPADWRAGYQTERQKIDVVTAELKKNAGYFTTELSQYQQIQTTLDKYAKAMGQENGDHAAAVEKAKRLYQSLQAAIQSGSEQLIVNAQHSCLEMLRKQPSAFVEIVGNPPSRACERPAPMPTPAPAQPQP